MAERKRKPARPSRSTKRAPEKTRAEKVEDREAAAAEAAREKEHDRKHLDAEAHEKAKAYDRLMEAANSSPFRKLLSKALKPSKARNNGGSWKRPFLEALAATCNVTIACKVAGVDRTTVYVHRDQDPKFAEAWKMALDMAVELMEAEMHRRAFEGVQRPVFQGGALAGVVQEFSDTLAIFLMKAHRPEKYRDRISVKDDTPRGPIDPAAAAAAVARFLGEMQSGAPPAGAGPGEAGPRPG